MLDASALAAILVAVFVYAALTGCGAQGVHGAGLSAVVWRALWALAAGALMAVSVKRRAGNATRLALLQRRLGREPSAHAHAHDADDARAAGVEYASERFPR